MNDQEEISVECKEEYSKPITLEMNMYDDELNIFYFFLS